MRLLHARNTVIVIWKKGFRVLGFSLEGMGFKRGAHCWQIGPFFYVSKADTK